MLRCFFRALEFTQSNNKYHGIHIYFHIISLEPPTRALCFSFESTHNYSKDLSRKQKFINLSVFLARRHKKNEMLQLYQQTGVNYIYCLQLEKSSV